MQKEGWGEDNGNDQGDDRDPCARDQEAIAMKRRSR